MLHKKDFVCLNPFDRIELFHDTSTMCCPFWLPVDLGDPVNIKDNWSSELAESVRESIKNGSYSFCDDNVCSRLIGLKNDIIDGLIPKEEFLKIENEFKGFPKTVKFNFDRSCNLKCPSCRTKKINYTGYEKIRTELILQHIDDNLSKEIEKIECTGTGDPFFSSTYFKWLVNFKLELYPNLKSIHLHTNATLWNESNWNKIKNVQRFITSAEISIDAATKETYENKVRLGGNWNVLQKNLRFISTLNLDIIFFSFVVQNSNYKEIELFYEMIKNIFDDTPIKWKIFYSRIMNWGTFDDETFKMIDVGNIEHANYNDMVEIYNKLPLLNNIHNNLDLNLTDKLV